MRTAVLFKIHAPLANKKRLVQRFGSFLFSKHVTKRLPIITFGLSGRSSRERARKELLFIGLYRFLLVEKRKRASSLRLSPYSMCLELRITWSGRVAAPDGGVQGEQWKAESWWCKASTSGELGNSKEMRFVKYNAGRDDCYVGLKLLYPQLGQQSRGQQIFGQLLDEQTRKQSERLGT